MGIRNAVNRLIKLLLCISFYLVIPSLHANSFETLTQVQAYADLHPEYVTPDNNDWLRPHFSSFHKKIMPSLFQRVLHRIGVETSAWDWQCFSTLVEKLVDDRKKDTLAGNFNEQFSPSEGYKFIIWGDLNGALHSLVRDLSYLEKKGIIDNAFKISAPYYFIFNGNVMEGSSYGLETLMVVLRLMEANPDRVIYTRGYSEAEERWQNFEFIRDLKIRLKQYSSQYNRVISLLSEFFQTLPIALYLTQENNDERDVVIISSNDSITRNFAGKALEGLEQTKRKRTYFKFVKKHHGLPAKKINLRAFITGENRSVSYNLTEGLTRIGAIEGAIRWMVFSSPTQRSQVLYKFYYDAFVELHVTNSMSDWTIGLFNQKVPALGGFKEATLYNLVTGRKQTIGEKDTVEEELFFGSTMDLSKGASPIGKRVREGLQLAFAKERTERTLPTILPRLITVNDEYTPQKTRSAVEDFIEKDVTMLIGSQGSPSLESYVDLIKNNGVLVMFPFTGSPIFRKPDLKNIIHYRGSYIREGQELIEYALKDLKAKKIAIFYQDDAFGRGALEGARRALRDAGITNSLEIPHERNVVNYTNQAKEIRDYNPDTILFSTNTLAIRGLIRQMGVQYFAGKKLLGLSVYEDAFERFLKDKGLTFVLVRMVPDPAISDLLIAKEYRKWADAYNVAYDKVSFEQFINATILFEILAQIKGPVTKEKIIAIAQNMKDYPLKGLILNFNPETRELSETLWIDPGKDEWIQKSRRDDHEHAQKKEDEKTLRMASLMDLSKALKAQGKAIKTGIELRLNEAYDNKVQEVPTILIVDDNYDSKITKQKITQLMKDGIKIIVCPVGSPTLESYLNLVKDGKITVLFPITGSPLFRVPGLTHLINLRASYEIEGKVLPNYAIDRMQSKKIVLFYQDDAFGKGLLDAAHQVLNSHKAVDALDVPYTHNNFDFSDQVKRIAQYKPDTIIFFSTATAARKLIRQFGITNVVKLKLLGNSDIGETEFINFIKDTGLDFVYVNAVPNPANSQLPIVKQYRAQSEKKHAILDTFSLEAYIAIDILLYVLRLIPGKVTQDTIMRKLEEFNNQEYKGLILNFDSQTRTLLHMLWLDVGKPDWQEINVAKYNI